MHFLYDEWHFAIHKYVITAQKNKYTCAIKCQDQTNYNYLKYLRPKSFTLLHHIAQKTHMGASLKN